MINEPSLVGGRFIEDQIEEMVRGRRFERRVSPNAGGYSIAYYLGQNALVLGFWLKDTSVMPFQYELGYCDKNMINVVKQVHEKWKLWFTEAEIAQKLIEYHFRRNAYGAGSIEVNTIEYHLDETMLFQFTKISRTDRFELVYCDASMSQLAIEKFGWVLKSDLETFTHDPDDPEELSDWSATDHGTYEQYGHRGPKGDYGY